MVVPLPSISLVPAATNISSSLLRNTWFSGGRVVCHWAKQSDANVFEMVWAGCFGGSRPEVRSVVFRARKSHLEQIEYKFIFGHPQISERYLCAVIYSSFGYSGQTAASVT